MIDCHIQLNLGKFKLDQTFSSEHPVVGLFGASGSGKTSILHAIADLILQSRAGLKSIIRHGSMLKIRLI